MEIFMLPKVELGVLFRLLGSASKQPGHQPDRVHTPAISRHGSQTVSPNGVVTTVADHLPSSQTSPAFGNLVSGVADLAFIDGNLYALLGGAGCSHGLAGTNNGVIRVHSDGTWTQNRKPQHLSEESSRV
jgi:hypothetical protein